MTPNVSAVMLFGAPVGLLSAVIVARSWPAAMRAASRERRTREAETGTPIVGVIVGVKVAVAIGVNVRLRPAQGWACRSVPPRSPCRRGRCRVVRVGRQNREVVAAGDHARLQFRSGGGGGMQKSG